MELTDRQKIGHLLRRFGFGASVWEMEEFVPLGVRGTIDRLLNFEETDIGDPMQFAFIYGEEAQPGGYRFRLWWALQMVATKNPLREKLALFWHDHFAVNEEDVEHGLAMLDYLERLRRNPAGKFGEILKKMSWSPAVMRQLNVEMISRAVPNENFARELLELYTLGEGNGYSERDIKELSKALTGWSHMDVYWRMGKTNDERLRYMRQHDTPPVFFIQAPEVNIPGKKSVLGKQVETGDEVLDMLAHHPQTARYICTKLWEWFAYKNPEKSVIERLAKRFIATDGDIKLVLKVMAEMDEFYGEKSYRRLVKNPVDYVVGICRSQNAGPRLLKEFESTANYDQPMKEDVVAGCGAVVYTLSQCGMNLFLPETVAGWDWFDGWITTNTLLERRRFTGAHTWYPVDQEGKPREWHPDIPVKFVINEIRKRSPKSEDELVNAFCMVYDCLLSAEQQSVLAQHFKKTGAMINLSKDREFGWSCTVALQILGSAPEFQLC